MAIPLALCTVSVLRGVESGDDEAYGAPVGRRVVVSGVRAVIGPERGQESSAGASQTTVLFRLNCDPVPDGIEHDDWIQDERTGVTYSVIWAVPRFGLGMDHINARLSLVTGLVGRKHVTQGSRS